MHTPSPLPGKITNPSFEARLNAYAQESKTATQTTSPTTILGKLCACSMAAGAVLGLAQPAFSAIVYSGLQNKDLPLDNNVTATFDIDDGNGDFIFEGSNGGGGVAKLLRGTGQGFLRTTNSPVPISNLVENAPISVYATNWRAFGAYGLLNQEDINGNFIDQEGYIGIRIESVAFPNNFYHGWIRYKGERDGTKFGTIIDWAYNDDVNAGIRAGQMPDPGPGPGPDPDPDPEPTAIPTLSEWGMIILVALLAGLGMHRIRKQKDGDDHLAGA
jgi:hypothetical protein